MIFGNRGREKRKRPYPDTQERGLADIRVGYTPDGHLLAIGTDSIDSIPLRGIPWMCVMELQVT